MAERLSERIGNLFLGWDEREENVYLKDHISRECADGLISDAEALEAIAEAAVWECDRRMVSPGLLAAVRVLRKGK